jgi:hypothetical protein
MTWVNTDIFGNGNYDLGGSLSLPTVPPSTGGTFASDIFGFGKDLFGGYLELKGQEALVSEQTKLALALQNQNQMLGVAEQQTNVNAQTLEPWQIAALTNSSNSAFGISDKNLMWLLFAAVAYTAIK